MELAVEPGWGRRLPLGNRTRVLALIQGYEDANDGRAYETVATRAAFKRVGLRRLGSGAYKVAFTDGRFVYKVGFSLSDEFDNANKYRAQGCRWAAPTSLWREVTDKHYERVVLVQPLYRHLAALPSEKVSSLWRKVERLERKPFWLSDMHEDNFGATAGGHLRIWDLG